MYMFVWFLLQFDFDELKKQVEASLQRSKELKAEAERVNNAGIQGCLPFWLQDPSKESFYLFYQTLQFDVENFLLSITSTALFTYISLTSYLFQNSVILWMTWMTI